MTLASRTSVWLPPLALMGVIFVLSAQPDLNSGLGVIDTIGRKIVHASEYALLALLWWRAFRHTGLRSRAVVIALALTVAYAITDEYHQTFTHARHGTPVDVAIDSFGALVAMAAVRRRE